MSASQLGSAHAPAQASQALQRAYPTRVSQQSRTLELREQSLTFLAAPNGCVVHIHCQVSEQNTTTRAATRAVCGLATTWHSLTVRRYSGALLCATCLHRLLRHYPAEWYALVEASAAGEHNRAG